MNKWIELIVGLILIILPLSIAISTIGLGAWDFGTPTWELFKGALIWGLIILGLLFILLGISDLREK
jgi:hypothetical protein